MRLLLQRTVRSLSTPSSFECKSFERIDGMQTLKLALSKHTSVIELRETDVELMPP